MWTSSVAKTFDNLKQPFTFAPFFVHVDLEKLFTTKANTFDFALESVLSRLTHEEKLQPIALHSRKREPREINPDGPS